MTKFSKILTVLILGIFFCAGNAFASSIADIVTGINITKYDGEHKAGNTGWYSDNEDQEVEMGMQTGQKWDMEAMYFDSAASTLFIVAGFDFKDGEDGNGINWAAGDVFFGPDLGYDQTSYDYVFDFARTGNGDETNNLAMGSETDHGDYKTSTGTFNVYEAYGVGGLDTAEVFYGQNDDPSNPYAHVDGDDTLKGSSTYTFYEGDGTPLGDGLGISGEYHYILALNLAGIGFDLSGLEVHMTLECGNDNLEGDVPVPEPATMLLFGSGLIGFAGLGRKKFLKRT